MQEESFPLKEDVLGSFIEENAKVWNLDTKQNSCKDINKNKYVYINLSMVRMQMAWVVPKLIAAKGIEEQDGSIPVVLTWNENKSVSRLLDSFKIKHIALNNICYRNPIIVFRAFVKAIMLLRKKADIGNLLSEKIGAYNIGTDIYEDILRTSSLSTAKSCKNTVVLKKYIHIMCTIYALQNIVEKMPPSYALMDDHAYHEGAFIKLFRMNGARVYGYSNFSYHEILFDENNNVYRRPYMNHIKVKSKIQDSMPDILEKADRFLEERFAGKNGRSIDRQAFAGKVCLDRDETIARLGLDHDKKNVVIMAHTFTDAIYNYGYYYFRDYYDWLEQTLEIAKNVSTVNWILKPHPTRHAYNEDTDSIEDMFARHKNENMYYMDDDISAETLKNVADVIITIGGNAGAEFACVGVPSVIVGKPYYRDFGYTIEPKSYDEYRECLEHIDRVERLDENQIAVAKKVFYTFNNMPREEFLDGAEYEFATELNEKYREMMNELSVQYFANNDGTESYNSSILAWITQYIKEHDVRRISYYVEGRNIVTKVAGIKNSDE